MILLFRIFSKKRNKEKVSSRKEVLKTFDKMTKQFFLKLPAT